MFVYALFCVCQLIKYTPDHVLNIKFKNVCIYKKSVSPQSINYDQYNSMKQTPFIRHLGLKSETFC